MSKKGRTATALALSALSIPAAGKQAAVPLPAELRGYRAWHASDVHAASIPLSLLCAALPPQELARRRAELRRQQGLHAERYLRVYANGPAQNARPEGSAFPPGSILAKEKLLHPNAGEAEGVAFMIKHAPGQFAESGGWEFRYYPQARGASYAACIECHRGGGSRDYVFSNLR